MYIVLAHVCRVVAQSSGRMTDTDRNRMHPNALGFHSRAHTHIPCAPSLSSHHTHFLPYTHAPRPSSPPPPRRRYRRNKENNNWWHGKNKYGDEGMSCVPFKCGGPQCACFRHAGLIVLFAFCNCVVCRIPSSLLHCLPSPKQTSDLTF